MFEIVSYIVGGGAATAIIQGIFRRRKSKNEADQGAVNVANSVVKLYGELIEDLGKKVKELELELKTRTEEYRHESLEWRKKESALLRRIHGLEGIVNQLITEDKLEPSEVKEMKKKMLTLAEQE